MQTNGKPVEEAAYMWPVTKRSVYSGEHQLLSVERPESEGSIYSMLMFVQILSPSFLCKVGFSVWSRDG